MNCMNDFPEELSSLFRETSCLKVNEEEGTWLCEEISGKKRVIVKVAFTDEAAFLQKNEQDILTRIHQSSAAMAAYFFTRFCTARCVIRLR